MWLHFAMLAISNLTSWFPYQIPGSSLELNNFLIFCFKVLSTCLVSLRVIALLLWVDSVCLCATAVSHVVEGCPSRHAGEPRCLSCRCLRETIRISARITTLIRTCVFIWIRLRSSSINFWIKNVPSIWNYWVESGTYGLEIKSFCFS